MDVDKAIVEVSNDLGLTLKEKQREAIKGFCLGRDVFVGLPTGYGKSIIFATIPLIFDKVKGLEADIVFSTLLINVLFI